MNEFAGPRKLQCVQNKPFALSNTQAAKAIQSPRRAILLGGMLGGMLGAMIGALP